MHQAPGRRSPTIRRLGWRRKSLIRLMALAATRAKQVGRMFRFGLGAAVLGYGAHIAEPGAPRLMIFGLTLFALPLLFQFSRWVRARVYALWVGVFLVIQSVMTPLLLDDVPLLVRRAPNVALNRTFDDGSVPGTARRRRFTTDERGFRVNPRVDYEHKSGIRIFAIGGSTTEELPLDDEETWTHRLQVA